MSTSPPPAPSPLRRECFITIGATATFTPLLTTALSLPFLRTLSSLSYTHLILQCGDDLSKAQELIATLQPELQRLGLTVSAFAFNKEGLGREMRGCKGSELPRGGYRLVGLRQEREVQRREGVCVCHAGAGTILDALRLSIPIIVVPNPSLLDNHQQELADELARLGYVVHGRLDDLPAALLESEEKSKMRKGWVPEGGAEGERGDLMDVVDEELGYAPAVREDRRREEMVREVLD